MLKTKQTSDLIVTPSSFILLRGPREKHRQQYQHRGWWVTPLQRPPLWIIKWHLCVGCQFTASQLPQCSLPYMLLNKILNSLTISPLKCVQYLAFSIEGAGGSVQEEQAFCNFLQGGGWQGLYDVRTSSGACPVTAIERHPMILQPWSGVNLPRAFSTWKQTLELPLT